LYLPVGKDEPLLYYLPLEPVNMLDAVPGAPGLLLPEKKNMILCYWNLVLIQVVCIQTLCFHMDVIECVDCI